MITISIAIGTSMTANMNINMVMVASGGHPQSRVWLPGVGLLLLRLMGVWRVTEVLLAPSYSPLVEHRYPAGQVRVGIRDVTATLQPAAAAPWSTGGREGSCSAAGG
jgi:hypothetical protein